MSQDYNPSQTIGLEGHLKMIKGWILDTKDTLQLQIAIVGMGGYYIAFIRDVIVDFINSFLYYSSHCICLPTTSLS